MATSAKRRVTASSFAHVLPEEMMTEVFLRLPVKSILRFRAVCRSWAELLSSEEFCSLHMNMPEATSVSPKVSFALPKAGLNSTAVYLCSSLGRDDDPLFTLDDVCAESVDMTPAPCRGLTLLCDARASAYYVFNAATRAVTSLPPYQVAAFDTAGLGFDARAKKHKVVRLFQGNYLDTQRIKCEIHTLGGEPRNSWRPAIGGVPFRFCSAAESAINHAMRDSVLPTFANGFLHWLTRPLFVIKRPRAAILAFSVTDESFSWVQSPPFVAPGVRFGETNGHWCMVQYGAVSGAHLVELAGQLCMVRDLRNTSFDCSTLEIWKLNDRSSGGWSLEHRIDLVVHVARDLIEPQVVKVIGYVGDGNGSKKIIIATSERKVIAYDPMFGTLETIIATRVTRSCQTEKNALGVSLFKESLVPVHQTDEEIALSAPLPKATREI